MQKNLRRVGLILVAFEEHNGAITATCCFYSLVASVVVGVLCIKRAAL